MGTTVIRTSAIWHGLLSAIRLTLIAIAWLVLCKDDMFKKAYGITETKKGYGITGTGLRPIYPSGYSCSPLTSLYASMRDVDGTRREEPHSGVDGGRFGDAVLAPADGTVKAVWRANWGWGEEGALIIRHSREDLNLLTGAPFYYSEFDHLRYEDVVRLKEGQQVKRGDRIGTVDRPGGKRKYLPEVHWEVHEVTDDSAIEWKVGKYGTQIWTNKASEIIDPLYLMSLNADPATRNGVRITPFDASTDYSQFRGFTYILPCPRENG